ncbi:MAG: hypothetical protein HW388_1149 [Dehalococcoidia bacterium]|nr:hypothetical protein [Dehalococcoidia bacterium]
MVSPLVLVKSFTTGYNGKSNVLESKVRISSAFDPAVHIPSDSAREYTAVWDTGATNSVITQTVVDECQLQPTGIVEVHTPQGHHTTETFLVGLFLPNFVYIPSLIVSKGILSGAPEILVGMDVIGRGDFAVTNLNDQTVFSFRTPSVERIDFTGKASQSNQPTMTKVGRNQPCPCGSGKKYKRCHGVT